MYFKLSVKSQIVNQCHHAPTASPKVMTEQHILIMLSHFFRETHIHFQGCLDDLVCRVQSDIGETILVAHESMLGQGIRNFGNDNSEETDDIDDTTAD